MMNPVMTSMRKTRIKYMLAGCVSVSAMLTGTVGAAADGAAVDYAIPSDKLESVLRQYAEQSDTAIIFSTDLARKIPSTGLKGSYAPEVALDMLLQGTGLIHQKDDGLVIIKKAERALNTDTMQVASQEGNEENSFVLEEIIVTATKRAESLQDVPLSITALSASAIERQGIEGSDDFARQVPGIIRNSFGKNIGSFTFRGIGTANFIENIQPTVAVYLDELPMTSAESLTTPNPRLFDVERVEVLRGPQGTLFGSGSLSGAVRLVTKKADPTGFDAAASVDFGLTKSDSFRQRYNAMVNIPLVDDRLAVRAVGYYRNEDGYMDNIRQSVENSDSNEDWGFRSSLRWNATDRLTATFGVVHENAQPNDNSLYNPDLGKFKRSTFVLDQWASELTHYNGTIEYDFGGAMLTSSSTYSVAALQTVDDLSGLFPGVAPFGFYRDDDAKTFVEEIRVVSTTDSALEWVVGGFFLDRKTNRTDALMGDPAHLAAKGITGALPVEINGQSLLGVSRNRADFDTQELAGFGELSWHLTDELTLVGGLRYGYAKVSILRHDTSLDSNFFALAFGDGGPLVFTPLEERYLTTGKKNKLTKKLSLTWEPSDQQTYYLQAAEGYRIGTINPAGFTRGGLSRIDPTDIRIPEFTKPDTLWNYEAGAKLTWFDGRLKTNVALYYIPWKDIQLNANRVSDGVDFIANISKAVSKGVELEMQAWPTDALELGLNVTLQDAEITKVTEDEANFSGAEVGAPLASPDFQLSGYIQYSWELSGGQEMFARLDAQHLGAYPNGLPNLPGSPGTNNPFITEVDAYENVNVSIGWATDSWMVMVYGENILNNDNSTYIHPESIVPDKHATLRPRTFGIRASWKY